MLAGLAWVGLAVVFAVLAYFYPNSHTVYPIYAPAAHAPQRARWHRLLRKLREPPATGHRAWACARNQRRTSSGVSRMVYMCHISHIHTRKKFHAESASLAASLTTWATRPRAG